MKYGICPISIAPLRSETSDSSEMVSQVLYGETFKIIDTRKKWSRIRLSHDKYEGWIDNKQITEIESEQYHSILKGHKQFSRDLIGHITHNDMTLSTVTIGAQTSSCTFLNDQYSLNQPETISYDKSNLIENALLFLNAPYLWGGRTPLGIDCSGFTQLIYRMNGFDLLRDASQQATQGEVLSFIEESEPGDLAFFDNNEGAITHVGLIMSDNYIIHAHGKVRIDRLDQSGIFNVEKKVHTHKLRVIKKIL
ncbi:SH3 domain-containing protein [Nonlabens dokdonensis]|uniref:SH3 domain-containing protein n=2 Tax=Nonlabens dokdonensis TaxID=328515 RepID=A0ABX5PX19_9FLAO|nr:C40 family peptidase [Nonlabens dokdonensis]AGC77729.1 putative cell wall-associated hydrolase (Invasion-associated proteins), NlpC/P60 family [Nonlabens dokdonensis DSW-6]PZX39734.1 SH3 domain-containing protein [Nonlabens dokdonensis]